jgi:hypothetical protein
MLIWLGRRNSGSTTEWFLILIRSHVNLLRREIKLFRAKSCSFTRQRWAKFQCFDSLRPRDQRDLLCSISPAGRYISITVWWHKPERRGGSEGKKRTVEWVNLLRDTRTQRLAARSELNCLSLISAVIEYGLICTTQTRKLPSAHMPSHCNRALSLYVSKSIAGMIMRRCLKSYTAMKTEPVSATKVQGQPTRFFLKSRFFFFVLWADLQVHLVS